MSSLIFYLRASSRGDTFPGRLCLRLVHQRKSKTLASPYRLYPEEWDAHSQSVTGSSDVARLQILEDTSRYILHTRELFGQISQRFSDRAYYSIQEIASQLCPVRYNKDSLVDYARRLSVQLSSSGRERTARAYRSSMNKLLGFIGKRDIRFADITPSLILAFEDYLKASGKSPNTISFYMRNLRAVFNRAVEENLVSGHKMPFTGVFTGFHKTAKRALDTCQMKNLLELPYHCYLTRGTSPCNLQEEKMYTAWRYFTFCFHARGMCFVDMAYLRKDNIRDGVIHYYRKKTGGLIEVKLTPFLRSILDSFRREVIDSPYLFPVITTEDKDRLQYETGLRTQNRRLKELAHKAGISTKLSTHVSRHSWASIAKSENLPLWVISEGLGHTNEKTTYTYLASLERSRLDMANEMIYAAVRSRASPAINVKKTI
ncbi:integrase [Dysgonomonas sp. PFB1-18]|uniref:tyrosine-type recombinase/integrase n=1 Tax=unclassified Dysgonomonas TaxID=2630389 RepID=UPI0024744D7E|nr:MULTISPECIES: site-specific integrase [unclassified Dysgonomonas]MDH6311138.1 integrase [Dysgonomonas sp. PF1-14]MDH6341008.1 integrase [Dysgonomonas sp. PF1-16]MDH6382648.1 integrase [Dysgonomonas sp. PFB1-18]MDH6400003.1 integrase [Dysgonomonas sp. PF1-23]